MELTAAEGMELVKRLRKKLEDQLDSVDSSDKYVCSNCAHELTENNVCDVATL